MNAMVVAEEDPVTPVILTFAVGTFTIEAMLLIKTLLAVAALRCQDVTGTPLIVWVVRTVTGGHVATTSGAGAALVRAETPLFLSIPPRPPLLIKL